MRHDETQGAQTGTDEDAGDAGMSLLQKMMVTFMLLGFLGIAAGVSTMDYPKTQAVVKVVTGLSLFGVCACLLWHVWMKL
jgi:hypothetical protein